MTFRRTILLTLACLFALSCTTGLDNQMEAVLDKM